jgi:hypothetical protein
MRAAGLAAALIVGLALPGCSGHQGTDSDARPLVMVLFDVSKSTQDPAIRERYLRSFERVVDVVASEHGTVVGDVIDENPLAHSSYPIDATFESCDPLRDNKLVCDARAAKLRDDVTAGAEAILGSRPTRAGTDIHDGLRLAERVFAAYPEATSRTLVVLSDMVEHSSGLDMGPTFDGSTVDSQLDALQAGGSIPNLAGVQVYVVGAGVVTSSELPAARILAIQDFWQAYFTASGADLPADRYGAALVRFP